MNLFWLITLLVLISLSMLAYYLILNQQLKREQQHLLQIQQQLERLNQTLMQMEHEVRQHQQQKQQLEQVHQSQTEYFEQILAALPQAVFWKNQHGVYLGCNQTFAQQLGLSTPTEIVGKKDEDLPGLGAQANFYQRCEQAVMEKGESLANTEEIKELANGRNTILLAQRYPLRDNNGQVIGILGLCTDISAQRHLEQQKNTQLAHLIEIDQVINQYIDFEKQIPELLQTAVDLLHVDRAWLLYPCDPAVSVAQVVFKNTQGPFAKSLASELPITPALAAEFKTLLNAQHSIAYAAPVDLQQSLATQAALMIVIYPHQDKPWLFSVDQCRQSYQWDKEEQQLFQTIAQRLTQSLTHRQLMNQLKATKAQQQFFLDHTPDLICVKDDQNRWQVANKTYLKLLQLDALDYHDQTDAELAAQTPLIEAVLRLSEQFDHQAWAQKLPLRTEESFPQPDGNVKIFEVIRSPLFTPQGERQALLMLGRDMTEHQHNQTVLQASQTRLANIVVDIADDAIISINQYQEIILFNQGAEKLFGYTTAAVLGQPLSILLPPEVVDKHYQHVVHFAQSAESSRKMAERREIMGRRQDGSLFPAQASIAQFKTDKEVILTVILRDITLRKWAENALEQSELRYRSLFEHAPISQWELDYTAVKAYLDELQLTTPTVLQQYLDSHPEFIQRCIAAIKVIALNQMTLNLFEAQTPKQLLAHLPQPLGLEAKTILQKQLSILLSGQTLLETETRYRTLNGKHLDAVIKFHLVPGYEANWQKVLLSIVDITALKQAKGALTQERKQVEEQTVNLHHKIAELNRLVRSRDEFLACTSHDLRAPLNSVLNTTEILQEQIFGSLTEKQFKYLENIKNSGRHLLSLINDILDVSEIEADTLTLEVDIVPVQEVCQSSLIIVKEMVHKKRLKLTSSFDNSVNALRADPRRLKQILVNLLSNAVKFTPEGGTIGLEVQGDPHHCELHFMIWDTGIGIPEQDKQSLFEPFHRIKSNLMSQTAGTGLGLVLVRRLTEMHGGHISLTSKVDQGARFTVSLPWHPEDNITLKETTQPTPSVPTPEPSATGESGALILLADDNESQLNTVKDFLQFKGYRIVTAKDGIEAIENAKHTQPDLILMDIQMPDMNGLDAMSYIRADPNLATIPIVAVTALAMNGDRERCLAAGANEYLSKPFNFKELLKTIMDQLAQQSSA